MLQETLEQTEVNRYTHTSIEMHTCGHIDKCQSFDKPGNTVIHLWKIITGYPLKQSVIIEGFGFGADIGRLVS